MSHHVRIARGALALDSWKGGNGDWNTPADWIGNAVPAASATATFATGSATPYTVTGDATIGAILVTNDSVTFDGAIAEVTGGGATFLTAQGTASVTLGATALFTGNNLDFAANTLLDVQGTLSTTGGVADVVVVEGLTGLLIDSGSLQVNQLYVQTGASYAGDLTLDNGGSVTLDTASLFGGNTVTLLGSGAIYASAAEGETTGSIGIGDAFAFAAAGVLNLAADPGVTLTISGAITGAGSVVATGGTVELAGINSYTGFTAAQNGTLQIDQPGALPGGLVYLQNGAFIDEPVSTNGTLVPVTYADTVVAGGTSDTVDAAAGGLLVFAGPGTLTFVGGTAASTVIGGTGILNATGGAAGDLIFGGTGGHDTIATGVGNSTIVGGAGADLVGNGPGDAVMVAGGQNVFFDASRDTGNVTIFGAAGDATTVQGGAGNVLALVQQSDATIYGGSGTMDIYTGPASLALDYVVGFGGGSTSVTGFNAATDQINLFGYANGTAAQAFASETVSGGNTLLELSDNTRIELFGVTNLTSANFSQV